MSELIKVNQRVMLTKHLVNEALLKMLKTRNIHKISIRELCQIAGINRTTFYNHYGSQYDVLNEIAEAYIQNTSFTVIHELAAGKQVDACLVGILQYVKDNLEFAKLILDTGNYDLISSIKISLPQFDHMVMKYLPDNLDLTEKKAIASYVQYGTLRLLKEWILSDCAVSPQEQVRLILKVAARTMNE
ncbi:TetR/AcrR family transcriptional regulator [Saccharibacillus sp. CPCC 101409]|uniref:TetR/AcrR family transcriptional regulator n=1 Tax=Saccharibacillus sp. CPCC 101409 TaxID=3058041 RepID=UPI002671F274|nr:TetR/AcrR family transcriptional regulator [Saccharibacillus sp. CPCC 101409]MDO3412401.1 TetR/AcrR family transcriptional regulator [Saccharibacillus sp. CPCC 101409]